MRAKLAEDASGPLDVVVTWVNGSDPGHLALYEKVTGKTMGPLDKERFREYGTLRFVLRSVEKYMPFVRRVYLVTNGQVPSWWNKRPESGGTLVTHKQIFVMKDKANHNVPIPNALPTFNSNAIDLNLRNIPGIAPFFAYLNDDMLLLRPVNKSDLVDPMTGLLQLSMEQWGAPTGMTGMWDLSLDNTNVLLNEYYNHTVTTCHKVTQHTSYIFHKGILDRISEEMPQAVLRTMQNRLRTAQDIVVPFLAANFAVEENLGRAANTMDSPMVLWTDNLDTNARVWKQILRHKGKSICIQDSFKNTEDNKAAVDDLQAKLCTLYPKRSRFEDPLSPNPCETQTP